MFGEDDPRGILRYSGIGPRGGLHREIGDAMRGRTEPFGGKPPAQRTDKATDAAFFEDEWVGDRSFASAWPAKSYATVMLATNTSVAS